VRNLAYVKVAIEAAVDSWREQVIREGRPIRGVAVRGYAPTFYPVPLASTASVAGHKVSTLLACMYDIDASDDDIVKAWNGVVEGLRNSVSLKAIMRARQAASALFKGYRFPDDHVFFVAIQFLKLVNLVRGYPLDLTKTRAMLSLPSGDRIGLDRTGIFTVGAAYRTRRRVPDMRATLRNPRGYRLPLKDLRVREAYRLLTDILPEKSDEVDLVFSLALEGGEQLYPLLYGKFDITLDLKAQPGKYIMDPYSEARRLITVSTRNPRKLLAEVLMPVIGVLRFRKLFGSPYTKSLPPYSLSEQKRYYRGLELLIADAASGEVREKKTQVDEGSHGLLSTIFGI
jgi:hypothetical protein